VSPPVWRPVSPASFPRLLAEPLWQAVPAQFFLLRASPAQVSWSPTELLRPLPPAAPVLSSPPQIASQHVPRQASSAPFFQFPAGPFRRAVAVRPFLLRPASPLLFPVLSDSQLLPPPVSLAQSAPLPLEPPRLIPLPVSSV